jgi:two-component system, chemotaxis family, response regulator Rcp1
MDLLYAEDNSSDVLLLKSALRLSDFFPNLTVVTDGVSALDWLHERRTNKKSLPSLILLDLNLPRKNGYDVLEVLKKDPDFNHIPVIIYTGSANPKDRAECLKLKADDFWEKPKDFDEAIKLAEQLKDRMLQPNQDLK